jgi:hypothetical protein
MHIGVDESLLQTWDESRQGWVRVSVGVLIWLLVYIHICMCL